MGHGQVSFMELVLDFESHAGRPLPPTPQSRFTGSELSLQEKGRVLRLAVTLLGRATGRESILPAAITTRCRALVPLGAGMVVGVKGRQLFTKSAAMWHHLQRLHQYNSEHWARQQQQAARRQHKQRRTQGKPGASSGDSLGQRERCLGKGGAKKTAGAYAGDFYAGPVIPQGARRGPQYQVTGPKEDPLSNVGTTPFLPPQRCAKARRPEQHPRLPRLWVCATHSSTHPQVRCSHARKRGGYPGGQASQGRGPAGAQGTLRASDEESGGGRPPPPPASGSAKECSKWPATGARVRRSPNRPPQRF